MKLEKREVTLNEKDTLQDMVFFEENLQTAYRSYSENAATKEGRALLLRHAEELTGKIERLRQLLAKPPKM